jgi:hypothetical protein
MMTYKESSSSRSRTSVALFAVTLAFGGLLPATAPGEIWLRCVVGTCGVSRVAEGTTVFEAGSCQSAISIDLVGLAPGSAVAVGCVERDLACNERVGAHVDSSRWPTATAPADEFRLVDAMELARDAGLDCLGTDPVPHEVLRAIATRHAASETRYAFAPEGPPVVVWPPDDAVVAEGSVPFVAEPRRDVRLNLVADDGVAGPISLNCAPQSGGTAVCGTMIELQPGAYRWTLVSGSAGQQHETAAQSLVVVAAEELAGSRRAHAERCAREGDDGASLVECMESGAVDGETRSGDSGSRPAED